MRPVMLMLAAAATIGAAPSRPPRHAAPYEAAGFEPNWEIRISGGRLTFDPGTTRPGFTIPAPRRQPTRRGYRLVMPRLVIDVRHERCGSYDGRTFTDTVHAWFEGRNHDGCGGAPIPRADLAYSSWSIDYVDRTRLPDRPYNYTIEVREGRVTLRSGCRDYGGSYRERRPLLRLADLGVTRTACPSRADERRILDILRAPMRMTFIDGDTLVLTNRAGSLRLLP
jgi:heat shock protein HslJ/uncharacterized membrane protein